MLRKILLVVLYSSMIVKVIALGNNNVVEGVDYVLITPSVPSSNVAKGKVNIKEFFSFNCFHCKDMESIVEDNFLSAKHIDFDKIQIVWPEKEIFVAYAKLNATIQLMNLNKLYIPVFLAIGNREDLSNKEKLKSFLLKNGLSKSQIAIFSSTYNSFSVDSKVKEYIKLTSAYGINGTPTFVVADQYMVKPALPNRVIEVVRYLVDKHLNLSVAKNKDTFKNTANENNSITKDRK